MSPKQYRSLVNYVTFESLYSTWFHKKSSNKAIHALYVASNKIVIKLFRYCSTVSFYGIANALNTLFKRETGQKSAQSTYKASYKSYKERKGEEHQGTVYCSVIARPLGFLNFRVNTTWGGFSKIHFFVLAMLYFQLSVERNQATTLVLILLKIEIEKRAIVKIVVYRDIIGST